MTNSTSSFNNSNIFTRISKNKLLKPFSLRSHYFFHFHLPRGRNTRNFSLVFKSVSLFLSFTTISRQVFLFSPNFLPALTTASLSPFWFPCCTHLVYSRFSFLFALFLAFSFHRLRTCRSPAVAFDSIQFFR